MDNLTPSDYNEFRQTLKVVSRQIFEAIVNELISQTIRNGLVAQVPIFTQEETAALMKKAAETFPTINGPESYVLRFYASIGTYQWESLFFLEVWNTYRSEPYVPEDMLRRIAERLRASGVPIKPEEV